MGMTSMAFPSKEAAVADFDWKAIVKGVAPMLGTALGGPLGGLAGSAIARALGTGSDEHALEAVIQKATPEQLQSIQKAEADFKIQMAKMGFENLQALEQIAAGDRANAREREIKTGDTWTPRVLAGVVIVGWFLVQWFLLTRLVPEANREVVVRGLGTLDMAVGLTLGYYFGSSASSARKDEIAGRQ